MFSHWLLDLLVHRPDLLLWPGGPKVGFALWNEPVSEEIVEIGLLGAGALAWVAKRKELGGKAWPAIAFFALLILVQIALSLGGAPFNPVSLGASALTVYAVLTAISVAVELRPRANAHAPAA